VRARQQSDGAAGVATEGAIDLSRLMRPRSVAIVGISPEPSSAGFLALRNLQEFGYRGTIHLVSRNQTQVAGRGCVRSIDDLPEGVDAALLFIPRVAIEEAVAACARRRIGGVVVFAAGFGEAGGEWQAAQDRIAAHVIGEIRDGEPGVEWVEK